MLKVVKLLATFALLLGSFAQVNASELFISQDAEIKAENGSKAKVFLGVPVTVKKEMGKTSKVLIHGFVDGTNVYSTKTKELLIATLEDGFKPVAKTGTEVELVGTVSTELLSADATDVWAEQEEFYFDMCSVCHAAPQVPHHSMIEWEALFAPMKGFAKLDEEEAAGLLRYIKSNAKDGLIKTEH